MSTEPKFTKGPWTLFIDDTGGEWTGWPISIGAAHDKDKSVVRPGGQYPYEWDAAMSQREAVANAHLIAAAPELYEALRRARDMLQSVAGDIEDGGSLDSLRGKYVMAILGARDAAWAALSKAEGRA